MNLTEILKDELVGSGVLGAVGGAMLGMIQRDNRFGPGIAALLSGTETDTALATILKRAGVAIPITIACAANSPPDNLNYPAIFAITAACAYATNLLAQHVIYGR